MFAFIVLDLASWALAKRLAGKNVSGIICLCRVGRKTLAEKYAVVSCCQDSYIRSRSEAMLNIEQTIVELGTIFQQLAHMVKEQEEMVQR